MEATDEGGLLMVVPRPVVLAGGLAHVEERIHSIVRVVINIHMDDSKWL